MNRALALADRIAAPALGLLAALNVLFLLAFLLSLALAVGAARAQDAGCGGRDLLSRLRTDDPAKAARIAAESDATLNGRGRLWKVEREGTAPSHLFGTMHMTDTRVTSLPEAAQAAFDAAATLVIETTDILQPSSILDVMAKRPELVMFTDGTTLPSLLAPADRAIVDSALRARGIPLGTVVKMKPWMLASIVALPRCELARKAKGAPVLDVKLALDAEATGKAVAGLETAVEQLEAMNSLPLAFHLNGLVKTLALGEAVDDVVETMTLLYLAGDIGTIWPMLRHVLPEAEGTASSYAAFEETMVTARNRTMVREAETHLTAGNVFIAVGALHLPGPEGLVELLRRQGYAVTAADGNFRGSRAFIRHSN